MNKVEIAYYNLRHEQSLEMAYFMNKPGNGVLHEQGLEMAYYMTIAETHTT